MNILLWPAHYLPSIGGLEIFTHSLAVQLKKMGHRILVLANNQNSYEYNEMTIEGIPVHIFPFVAALHSHKLEVIQKIIAQVRLLVEDFSPDLANVHGWLETVAFYQIRILQQIPFCLTIHGLLQQKTYSTQLCSQLWSQARGVNTVSHAMMDILLSQKWSHPSLRVIYNGIPSCRFTESAAPVKHNHLAMIGRLSGEKCFDVGLQALKIVRNTYPDATLCLVGGGDQWDSLVKLRRDLALDGAVEMTGSVPPDQVSHYIDKACIVLIPSSYESFCLVALESAMRARPVIASDVYGLKEVVEHGKTGLLVEPQNPEALAEAIGILFGQKERRVEMGTYAQMRASQMFTMEQCARSYLEMYENRPVVH